jgi:hypothetical protein
MIFTVAAGPASDGAVVLPEVRADVALCGDPFSLLI